MASGDAMDVESAGPPYGMDVEHLHPPRTADDGAVAESILLARRGVVAFLKGAKAEDIVPANSRVVIMDGNVRLRQAFRALLENGVRAAPVIDVTTHDYCGMLSVMDILDSLLHLYYTHGDEPPADLSPALNDYTINTWHRQQRLHHYRHLSPELSPFRFAYADAPLFDAVRLMRDAYMLHVPILARGKTLLHTLEHWRVLRFLHQQFGSREGERAGATDPQQASQLFRLTLSQLNLGTYSNLVSIDVSTPLLQCLQTMQQRALSALPVVDARNRLVEVYSRADVALLATGRCDATTLHMPVGEILQGVRRGVPFAGATCARSDVLGTVFERFERTGVHRLYVVGEAGVEGVVSLSDMLRYFLHGY